MKNIIIILFILISFTSFVNKEFNKESSHQKPPIDMFAGIWKCQNGNEVFIVNLWKTTDGYEGHYKKITVDANGNQVSEIYNSNKPIGNTTTNWPSAISTSGISQDNSIRGVIDDNTVAYTVRGGGFIGGDFVMKALNPNCFTPSANTCPLQAQWIVKKMAGLGNPAEPDFNIPKNIVLTKE